MAGFHFNRTKWIALAAVILAAAAAVWFFYFRKDDAAIVRARLREAAVFVEKQPGNNLQSIGMARTLGGFFTEDAELSISGEPNGVFVYNVSGRSAIEGGYAARRPRVSSLTIALSEIGVTFQDPDRKSATVKCSALVTGSVQDGGDFSEGRPVSAKMVRGDDGKWRFRSLRAEPAINYD